MKEKKYKKYFGRVLNFQNKNSTIKMNLELLCHFKRSKTSPKKMTFKIEGIFKNKKDVKYIQKYLKIKDNIVLKGIMINENSMLCKKIKCLFNTPLPIFAMGSPGAL